jgi:polyhydroxybutyrate depolymerase
MQRMGTPGEGRLHAGWRHARLMGRAAVWAALAGLLAGGNLLNGLSIGIDGGARQFAYALESGCGNPVATGDSSPTLIVGGNTLLADVERQYELHVPSTYDANTPTPLVFLHHYMSGAWPIPNIHNSMTISWPGPITPIVVRPRALALSSDDPEGTPRAWNLNLEWSDVEFIQALKNHLRATYCIDDNRIFHEGESSGSFGAQGTGCYTQASAIVGDRGGILHPQHAVTNWGFPLTPVPPSAACGPTPALLGFANDDLTIPYDTYAVPTIDFWVENNECSNSAQYDATATTAVCNNPAIENCTCQRYDDCTADLVVCTWDGGHGASEIAQPEAAWWFTQIDQYDANPVLYHETFPAGVPTHAWSPGADPGFHVEYLLDGRVHMDIPKDQAYAYNGRAEARLLADYWDMPTPQDFSVGVTVTNLRGNFPEARLVVEQGGQDIEITTYFHPLSGMLRGRVYVNGMPQGVSWAIDRPGISRLEGGSCWLIRADPITDMVTVYQRGMSTWPERGMSTWPDCAGDWNDVGTFANPFISLDMHDDANYPLHVSLSAWRNKAATANKDRYIRFDDVYFSRSSLAPGTLP